MRRFILLSFVLVFIFQNINSRERIKMNDSWSFILEDNPRFGKPDYDDKDWRMLDLPHDWSIEGKYDKSEPSGHMGGYMPCGTGWYRKHFNAPSGSNGKRFFICFDGVYMKSQVWINGIMVGEYPNGYNSFQYDITPFIRHDEENVLAVRVDNSLQPSSRWYTGSGIYRSVYLEVVDQLHFIDDGTFVTTPQVSADEATVHIEYKIICNNYPGSRFNWTDNTSLYVWTQGDKSPSGLQQTKGNNRVAKECTLTSILYDMEGQEVKRTSTIQTIGDFSYPEITQELTVESPELWSPDTPYLYKLVSTIAYDGEVKDRIEHTIGIREFKFSPETGMAINGNPYKVQGVCLHQSVGCFGSAVPAGVWRERLETLKEMGCNAIRIVYPIIPEFYDLCDSMGFLVTKEILDEWNRGQEWGYSETGYGKLAYTYHLYFDQWYETDMKRLIRRDRNRPCVFMYILGNEIPNQRIQGLELARKLQEITRKEDPTRPTTAACDFFVGANITGFMDIFDIAGYNYIDRIYPDSLYAAEHVRYPKRVLLGTETYHKTRNHVSIRETSSCIGEMIWVGYDYLGELESPDTRGWTCGILDIAGFPKPEYYLRKSYWSKKPVVHIAVERGKGRNFDWAPQNVADHWNFAEKGNEQLPVYVYSNCDEVELFLGSKSLGRKKVGADDYHTLWNIPFKSGKLRAVGYRNRKKVAEHQLTTAGESTALQASRIYKSDGIIRLEVEVVDKNNVRVPLATPLVFVDGLKNIQVLGFDNGSQYDASGIKYTSKKQGHAADGRLVIYLRPDDPGKTASLVLKSEGLKEKIVMF